MSQPSSQEQDHPNSRLERACDELDVKAARQALADGADPEFSDEDDMPMSMVVSYKAAYTSPGPEQWNKAARLLDALFQAGADPNPRWEPDRWVGGQAGIEIALAVLFNADENQACLAVVESWLRAGANPETPMKIVDQDMRPVEYVAWIHEHSGDPNDISKDLPKLPGHAHCMMLRLLARYGADVSRLRLENSGLEPALVEQVILGVDRDRIEQATSLTCSAERTPRRM